ncbi:YrbL family protein [Bacterioplanoides sp.]|uniref:YrbL family protein n=1 Tax=Bacterioplanoides sp. TaxID=2066072 RepID=UPI003AFFDE46
MAEIILTDKLVIGKGRDRICYQHPSNPSLCIKISIRDNKQSVREARYFSYLYKTGSDARHLSCYRGTVETNVGTGYLFDLIADDSGDVSKTLTELLKNGEISDQEIKQPIQQLSDYLVHNRICVRDISPSNIVYQKTGSGFELMIIDGVSNPGIYPWTIRFKHLVKRANDKSWASFHRKVQRLMAEQKQVTRVS